MKLNCMRIKSHFPIKRMGTKTYFKKEAKDILEMAYQVLNVVFYVMVLIFFFNV